MYEKDKEKKLNKDPKTTGHEWDGIQEFDSPDPLWLRYTFYIALFFALGYWFMYPSWPSQYNNGILGWSEYSELNKSLDEVAKVRNQYLEEFNKMSFDEIQKDEKMYKFAIAGGRIAFLNNCAVCHGIGGGGNDGYPNLTAGSWLWGGKIEDIYQTIKYGIRSEHDETRQSVMAAFGKDKILAPADIDVLANYVFNLAKKGVDNDPNGKALFLNNCASCHGSDGQGNHEFGAPALNDAIWLYGKGDLLTIHDIIYNGRAGVMPYWAGKLPDYTIRQLTLFVHQLGGGE
ncbi:MAG: cytochrome-c oxidase, cbb3-type subunit III [Rickettsiales bacterium]